MVRSGLGEVGICMPWAKLMSVVEMRGSGCVR